MANPVVALALPFRSQGGAIMDAVRVGVCQMATAGGLDIAPAACWTSLLPYTFNTLWAGHLNIRPQTGATFFGMIHDDIRPEPGWLDVLVRELLVHDADLISAVVPIKDGFGLTSTAVAETDYQWGPRRLTLAEVFDLPETFGSEHVGGKPLLVNSGLWVCRFDRPWCEKVGFRQQDRIVRLPDGRFLPQTFSEDWDFAAQVQRLGGRVMATRKVPLEHERPEWHNRRPWGTWTRDMDFSPDVPTQAV